MSSLSFIVNGQNLRSSLAEKYYSKYQFKAAVQVYEKIHLSEPQNLEVIEKLVHCYTRLNDLEKVEFWMSKSLKIDSANTKHFLGYATTLAANNKHDQAREWLEKTYKINSDKEVLNWINSYKNLNQFYADSSLYIINKTSYNSEYSDFSPTYYKDGIIFCSARENKKLAKYKYDFNNTWFIDLYHVKDSISSPTLYSNRINSRYHEGPVVFNAAFDTIYFTRNQLKGKKNISGDGVNKLKIYYASIKNGKWGEIKEFQLNNSEFSVGHPALVSDNVMIFVSDMPGGYGGTDLYQTTKINGVWQTPVNLGSKINTAGNEQFPFVDNKGVLYFASNGHPGLGGLDIFYTLSITGKSAVQNVGYPVNSNKDDFGFIVRDNKGFFSSNRNGVSDNDNIYSFTVKKEKNVYLLVKDEDGKNLSDVDLLVYNQTPESKNLKIEQKVLKYKLEYGDLKKIEFSKAGYTQREMFFTNNDYHLLKDNDTIFVALTKKEEPIIEKPVIAAATPALFKNNNIGQIIELDIKYDVNRAIINADAATKLDLLVTFLNNHPEIKVELGSHSDSRGSTELNQRLSQKRAESAVDYITSKGVSKERLIAVGYGKNQLKIVNAKTEEEHHQNRRTTVKIVE